MVPFLALATLLAASFLTAYFFRYQPRRPATLALAILCAALAIDNLIVILHIATHQAPQLYPLLATARLVTSLAVFVLLLIVIRHALLDDRPLH